MKYELGQKIAINCTITGASMGKNSGEVGYSTSIGMNFSERTLDNLLKPVCSSAPKQNEPKFKVGDLAKVIQNTTAHGFANGTIVKIIEVQSSYVKACSLDVQSLRDVKSRWNVFFEDIEPYAEPSLVVTHDMLVKLGACSGGMTLFDKLFPSGKGEFEDVCAQASKNGNENYSEWLDYRKSNIEAMQNEPKKVEPEYYNGKAVAIADNDAFIKGKIYLFKNGYVTDDDGDRRPMHAPVESINSSWFKL